MKKKIQIGPTVFAQKESVGDPPHPSMGIE